MIYRYTFEDGTVLRLLNIGLSGEEVWALEELHGKCKTDSIPYIPLALPLWSNWWDAPYKRESEER